MAQTMLNQANFSLIQSQSRMEQEQKDMETLLSTFTGSIGDQQDQNFSQDDMWDQCIPHEFVSFIYKQKNYNQISRLNLTYQKANNIVKEYLFEDMNRMNHLKYKIEEKFDLIQFVC